MSDSTSFPPETPPSPGVEEAVLPAIEARGIHKRFGSVVALDGVDFTAMPGECVGLIGDNGAGKSTLIKILSGALHADEGGISVAGRPVTFRTPADAQKEGVETVYQDLALGPTLDAPSNVFLGRELRRRGLLGRLGFLDREEMRSRSRELLATINVRLQSMRHPVTSLSGGQRQAVAIARALAWGRRILILDEPTAALGVRQTRVVMDLIQRLQSENPFLAIIIITHDLRRIFEVADRVVVLLHGRVAATYRIQDASMEDLVAAMTGADEGAGRDRGTDQ